jgi:hypothetical protein
MPRASSPAGAGTIPADQASPQPDSVALTRADAPASTSLAERCRDDRSTPIQAIAAGAPGVTWVSRSRGWGVLTCQRLRAPSLQVRLTR